MKYLSVACILLAAFFFTACDAKKSNLAGRWVTKETVVQKSALGGDRADNVIRTLALDANGNGEFVIVSNGDIIRKDVGKWSVVSDVFLLDHEGGKTIYFRILRITNERLVIRTEEGIERIYDRVQ